MALSCVVFAAGCGAKASTRARAFRDLPDDHRGPQIHFVYAVPGGLPLDNRRDIDGTLSTSIVLVFSWFHQQAGAPLLAVDTFRGRPDITFVRLPLTNSDYQRLGPGAVARDVARATRPRRGELDAIFYEGTLPMSEADVCGVGRPAPHAFAIAFIGQSCFNRLDFVSAGEGQYSRLVFVIAHEIVHELGFVPACAPHATRTGHVNDSLRDLMAPALGGKVPVLDVGHDDYYRSHVHGCPDLSRSAYLHGSRGLLGMKP